MPLWVWTILIVAALVFGTFLVLLARGKIY